VSRKGTQHKYPAKAASKVGGDQRRPKHL
jgi:hypothetical protein